MSIQNEFEHKIARSINIVTKLYVDEAKVEKYVFQPYIVMSMVAFKLFGLQLQI